MSTATTGNLALRDQLAAAIRAAELPMSTDRLAEVMPWRRVEWNTPCSWGCIGHRDAEHVRTIECRLTSHTVLIRRPGQEIYRQLRALERAGLVERVRFADHRSVYWRATSAPASELAELEAMWAL